MQEDSFTVYFLALWAPSLVSLATLIVAIWMIRAGREARSGSTRAGFGTRPEGNADRLQTALESAATLNSFSPNADHDPIARLRGSLRLSPLDYEAATSDISQHFRNGGIVSVNLGRMNQSEAARLVDFCSGMIAATAGWIFQLADDVIVLIPGVH